MELAEVHELVGRVASVDAGCSDRVVLEAAVGELRRLKSWVDGREASIARLLAGVSSFPEKSFADASRSSLRQAEQVLHRAETTDQAPEFGVSLDAGRVSGAHVDVLGRALRQAEPAVRAKLLGESRRLALIAEQSTPDEFARTMRTETRRLEDDGDGEARLERQRRAVRLNSWIDRDTGMGRWSASWDPETMVRLENRLDAQVRAMFHDSHPPGCPIDLLEKQSFLRAHALLALLDGGGARLGRPEIVVVIDTTTASNEPVIDWGLPVELPRRVLDELAERATVHTVVVRNGTIIQAPGELNLGRTTRIANRAQRRALGAVYATCAIPGCCVRYSRTKLHHVIWWRHLGLTNLDNLLPLCEQHHQNIHHDGWLLTLTPHRTLTLQFPDGTIMTTGPPTRGAA
ncbi:MAG: DUF222 domain-containing protein [Ilumatobacteraceae bacterium]